jgi:hypothetical protein
VMESFPSRLSRQESDSLVDTIEAHFREHGFGVYTADCGKLELSSDSQA